MQQANSADGGDPAGLGQPFTDRSPARPSSIHGSPARRRVGTLCLLGMLLAVPAAFASPGGGAAQPQMGWSSWSALRHDVSETKIQAEAAAMNSSGLETAGYKFINIDDGWYLDGTTNVDSYGRWVVDSSKFPGGMAALANYVHALGLKFGIYLTPGIPVEAYKNNSPIEGTAFHARDIVSDTTHYEKQYTWPSSMYFIDYAKNPAAAQAYVDSWARQLASWGVDYLKFDGVGTPDSGDVVAWRKALDASGRTIHLGLSNSLDYNNGNLWRQNANSWRVEGDIECYCSTLTNWSQIARRFSDLPRWGRFAGPGGWNDPDSVEVGNGSHTGLTAEERRTQLTLWAASAAPLLLGADLTSLDTGDLALLTNNEVIAIDQAGNPAKPVSQASQQQVWYAYNQADGTYTVALFNLGGSEATVKADWSALGFSGTAHVHDAWSKGAVGNFTDSFSASVPSHGSRLLKVTPPKDSSVTSTLVSGATSLCIDNANSRTTPQPLAIWSCNGGANQNLTASADGTVRVNGMCLDASGRGTAPGTVVETFQCNGQTNQQWQFNADNTITGVQSGLCLDVQGGLTTSGNGTPLILWGCHGGLNQKWYRR